MAEKYIKLIDTKSEDYTSEVVTVSDLTAPFETAGGGTAFGFGEVFVDFETDGNARLVVEGSLGQNSAFQPVYSAVKGLMHRMTGFPRMRLRLTDVTGGTHSAGIYGDLGSKSFIDFLIDLHLTTNLQLCLDAGDEDSYVSGQKWMDVSGNGHDFFLGADATVAADDPRFNGIAGGLSSNEYFSFDGGDLVRYDKSNEKWMDNLHRNGAKFTYFGWFYGVATGLGNALFGTDGFNPANIGVAFAIAADEKLAFQVSKGSCSRVLGLMRSDHPVSLPGWHAVAVVIDEAAGAGGSFFWLDGSYGQVNSCDTFDGTYKSPSSSNATHTMELGASGDGATPFDNNYGSAMSAFWEGRVLSKADLDSIWDVTRHRFGL